MHNNGGVIHLLIRVRVMVGVSSIVGKQVTPQDLHASVLQPYFFISRPTRQTVQCEQPVSYKQYCKYLGTL